MNALARYEFFIGMDVYDLYLGCQSQDHTHTRIRKGRTSYHDRARVRATLATESSLGMQPRDPPIAQTKERKKPKAQRKTAYSIGYLGFGMMAMDGRVNNKKLAKKEDNRKTTRYVHFEFASHQERRDQLLFSGLKK